MFFRTRKCPFARDEDPVAHMVSLLSEEADRAGTPFSEGERKLLGEDAPEHPLPEELRQRFTKLIGQLLEKEQEIGAEADPKSFGNSLEWAGDPAYPNVVALTEGLVISRRPPESLRGRLRREMKDLMQVIGCGLTIVLLLAIVVVFRVWIFGRR